MHTYSCGNCGGILSGPEVGRCPHCGALLRGTREGSEEERLRRQREYRRNRPEAIRRRQKIKEMFETIGGCILAFLGVALVLSIFIGGGAALGWFVLPPLFGYEARIPLAAGGMIVGGAVLYSVFLMLQWLLDQGARLTSRVVGISRKPDWMESISEEIDEKAHAHQLRVARTLIIFLLITLPLLGTIGWSYPRLLLLAIIFAALLLIYFWAKRNKIEVSVTDFFLIASMALYGLSALGERWLSSLPAAVVQHIGAFVGMVGGVVLAFYLVKRSVPPPPDRWELEYNAIRVAVFANPALLCDVPDEIRERIANELRALLAASPQAWETFSPALRKAFPELKPKPPSKNL